MARIADRTPFITAAEKLFGAGIKTVTRAQVQQVVDATGMVWPTWLTADPRNRLDRGLYSIERLTPVLPVKVATIRQDKKEPVVPKAAAPVLTPVEQTVPAANEEALAAMAAAAVQLNVAAPVNLVPEKASGYVPFGNFSDVRTIVKSGKFYPMYITGLSGNGKTMMIEQVCAAEKREMVRVNVTIETDEDDLIGGFRLIDGKTVWQNGPVIVAMERGAVLLLDEVDLGSNKLMCLQPVLEGKSIYLKKINKVITPVAGFNVIATANTKGKGSDDGRFIGTNVMNEAFLERFSITMEQEYPATKVEQKILNNVLATSGIVDPAFTDKLVQWADVIRKSFYEGAVSEIISTRRLVHICEAFVIFNQNREKAVTLCLNRFDIDTKTSFLDLYKKLDETVVPAEVPSDTVDATTDEVAF